ncbi:MAG: hypothetical protein RTV41_05685 [Candidatus Thorarchaeota archaeon]
MVLSSETPVIVFDYSHGQHRSAVESLDLSLQTELENLGYNVVWARGGINSTILNNATGLVIGAIYEPSNLFSSMEILAIQLWFNLGHKLLWVGSDSDFLGSYVNEEMSGILESIGSHVYPEPTSVDDPISNALASYRVIANKTSDDPFVSSIVDGVSGVLMHGPTLLYGSNSVLNPGASVNPVALESVMIENVYPLLYYGESAICNDLDTVPPIAHLEGDRGSFVCATIETHLGIWNDSIAIVSGSSPYGYYQPMFTSDYYGLEIEGDLLVTQAIEFAIAKVTESSINSSPDITYEEGVPGNFIVWQPFDLNPKSYNITLDDELLQEGTWNSSHEVIFILVDGLGVGQYDCTLTATNQDDQTFSDTVLVTIVAPQSPIISHPDDIVVILGDNQSVIVWNVSDQSPLYYEIYIDGELNQTHVWLPWESTSVIAQIEGLTLGVHNYTIRVFDMLLLEASDTVMVEVIEEGGTPSYVGQPDFVQIATLVISLGSAIGIIVLVILYFRRR